MVMKDLKELSRNDIKMTKGLAIISMVVLHLFCRKGDDVYGAPLLWITDNIPFVYYFGFLAEICVPLYCLCSGYAHYRLGESGGLSVKRNFKRLMKFLINFWIILIFFSVVGIIVKSQTIPVSFSEFLGNALLYKLSYNGAWWFVATYVLLVALSYLIFSLVKKVNGMLLFAAASAQLLFFWIFEAKIKELLSVNPVMSIVAVQFLNLVGDVLFAYICGMLIAKYNLISLIKNRNIKNYWLYICFILVSIAVCIAEKGILMPYYAVLVFIMFNTISKNALTVKVFSFLGEHSTNIWLVHMFFYLTLFPGLVQKLKYPFLMFTGMMAICIAVSFAANVVYKPVIKYLFDRKKNASV